MPPVFFRSAAEVSVIDLTLGEKVMDHMVLTSEGRHTTHNGRVNASLHVVVCVSADLVGLVVIENGKRSGDLLECANTGGNTIMCICTILVFVLCDSFVWIFRCASTALAVSLGSPSC